jgi:hypothetical protein
MGARTYEPGLRGLLKRTSTYIAKWYPLIVVFFSPEEVVALNVFVAALNGLIAALGAEEVNP